MKLHALVTAIGEDPDNPAATLVTLRAVRRQGGPLYSGELTVSLPDDSPRVTEFVRCILDGKLITITLDA